MSTLIHKWPSLTNSYRTADIEGWFAHNGWLRNATYVVTEKVHGSNCQFMFTPNESVRFFSRETEVPMTTFAGVDVGSVRIADRKLFNFLQFMADSTGATVSIFGEAYGGKASRGVTYTEKTIRYFGLMVNGCLRPPSELFSLVEPERCVPVLGHVAGFDEAMKLEPVFKSKLGSSEAEGVVIQPCYQVAVWERGEERDSYFIVKHKNPKFEERVSAPKPPREWSDKVEWLAETFAEYINQNRINSVYSKHGIIEDKRQIGTYIRLVLQDAHAEFEAEYADDFNALDQDEQRRVLNQGKLVKAFLDKEFSE